MPSPRLRTHIALALILLPVDAGLAVQPVGAIPAARSDEYNYRDGLAGLWNYQSCGARARAAEHRRLATELQSIESLARSKGLGPTLERMRDEYQRILAVATMTTCVRGPLAALAGARSSMAAFRSWVERAPAHVLTRAEIDAAAADEILAGVDAYAAAVLNRDEAAYRRIVDDGFVFGGGETPTDRDGFAAIVRGMNLIHHRMTERTVAMRDGVGIVTGTALLAVASAPQPEDSRIPYVATYRRRDGGWRMVALQMSPAPRP